MKKEPHAGLSAFDHFVGRPQELNLIFAVSFCIHLERVPAHNIQRSVGYNKRIWVNNNFLMRNFLTKNMNIYIIKFDISKREYREYI